MKQLEKEEEIQQTEWQTKKDFKLEKLQQIRRTLQDDATAGNSMSLGLGIFNMRVLTCRTYPKDRIWKPQQWLLRRGCPAWSHGTRRGILPWPCYDLEKVSSLTVPLSFLILLVFLTYLYSNTSGRNDTCMKPSTKIPGVLAMTFWLSFIALATLLL